MWACEWAVPAMLGFLGTALGLMQALSGLVGGDSITIEVNDIVPEDGPDPTLAGTVNVPFPGNVEGAVSYSVTEGCAGSSQTLRMTSVSAPVLQSCGGRPVRSS